MLRRIGFFLLCFEFFFSSIFFGAGHTWGWSVLVVSSGILFCLYWFEKIRFCTPLEFPRSIYLFIAMFSLSLFLSYMNPGSFTPIHPYPVNRLSQVSIEWDFPACLNPYLAKLSLYEWIVPLVTFFVTPYFISKDKERHRLLGCVIVMAALQAFYGIAQHFSLEDPLPFFAPPYKEGAVGGTYLCRNSFACFLAASVPLSLVFIFEWARRNSARYLWNDPKFLALLIGNIAIVLAVFLSLSRGGTLAVFLGIFFFVFLRTTQHKKVSWAQACLYLFFMASFATGYFLLIGMDPLLERFSKIGNAGRWEIWDSSFKILKDHWLFGIGGGSFFFAWEIYKPPLSGSYWYAHNDYLQFLIEHGAIAATCLFAFFCSWGYRVRKNVHTLFSCGLISSLCVFFTHSFVDFSLSIPGNRLLCAIFLAMLLDARPSNGSLEKVSATSC